MTVNPQGPGCVCRLEGPDAFGNYDLVEVPSCPIHGVAEENTMDPYDAVQDARAEAAHDGIDLSTADVIRLTLAFEETHDYYRKLSPAARHPFGLPTVDPAPPSPAAVVDIPRPSDRRLSSATGQTGRGHQLPDLPSAA